MLHSIISFYDDRGITIDFYRLQQKRTEAVLNAVFRAFMDAEQLYMRGLESRCQSVDIHYTEYELTEENKTYECSYEDFLKGFETYKKDVYKHRNLCKA